MDCKTRFTLDVRTIFIDKLCTANLKALLKGEISHVIVLGKVNAKQRKYANALARHGITVEEPNFFAGHLKSENGESIYLAAKKLSCEAALDAARRLIESQPLLQRLNAEYGRETLRLSLAKNIRRQIDACIILVLAAQSLSASQNTYIWMENPALFDGTILGKYFPGLRLHFYNVRRWRFLYFLKEIVWDFLRLIKRLSGFGKQIPKASASEFSMLMVQEDNIRARRTLRGQPHWIDINTPPSGFSSYICNLSPWLMVEDADTLAKVGVGLATTPTVRAAWKARKATPVLRKVSKERWGVLLAIFFTQGFAEASALLHVSRLLLEAERMGALAAWLNTRVFLIRETYMLSADAMQIVAPDLNITTIAYQYSNLGSPSLNLMSTADYFVIFSEMFKDVFQAEGISPRQWVLGGYLYDGIADLVRDKSKQHRTSLHANGAKFIVCYFDEQVHLDHWGLISHSDHLAELHQLATAVLSAPDLGLVVKTQFMWNSPSQLYPNDTLIQNARKTGRYIELAEGKHRNDIYPAEAALIADLCISHKFGATAALESAVAGARCVLLNRYGGKTRWDQLYQEAKIEFETIESILDAIHVARNDKNSKLGDWSSILGEFDPFRDSKASIRLRNLSYDILRQKSTQNADNKSIVTQ